MITLEIVSTRKIFTEKSCIAEYTINNIHECFVLEDADRGIKSTDSIEFIKSKKVHGTTAIPYGRYQIVVTKSDRFSMLRGHDVYLPLFKNVPGFDGIRIHTGNKPEDTEGCQLPGQQYQMDMVTHSTEAFIALNDKINAALKIGEVWITIIK